MISNSSLERESSANSLSEKSVNSSKLSQISQDIDVEYNEVNHRKMRVVVLSVECPCVVMEVDIYLPVNKMVRTDMADLDHALKMHHIKLDNSCVYWQVSPKNVLPVFNFITLAAALNSMAKLNNIFYIIKKEPSLKEPSFKTKYNIDPVHRDLIIELSKAIVDDPSFTGYTRFEETMYSMLASTSSKEHLPISTIFKEAPPKIQKKPEKVSGKSSEKKKKSGTPNVK